MFVLVGPVGCANGTASAGGDEDTGSYVEEVPDGPAIEPSVEPDDADSVEVSDPDTDPDADSLVGPPPTDAGDTPGPEAETGSSRDSTKLDGTNDIADTPNREAEIDGSDALGDGCAVTETCEGDAATGSTDTDVSSSDSEASDAGDGSDGDSTACVPAGAAIHEFAGVASDFGMAWSASDQCMVILRGDKDPSIPLGQVSKPPYELRCVDRCGEIAWFEWGMPDVPEFAPIVASDGSVRIVGVDGTGFPEFGPGIVSIRSVPSGSTADDSGSDWEYSFQEGVPLGSSTAAIAADGSLYLVVGGHLRSVSPLGQELWSAPLDLPGGSGELATNDPTLSSDGLYIALEQKELRRYSAEGELAWTQPLPNLGTQVCGPLLVGTEVIVPYTLGITAMSVAGEDPWTLGGPQFLSPRCPVATADGKVIVFNGSHVTVVQGGSAVFEFETTAIAKGATPILMTGEEVLYLAVEPLSSASAQVSVVSIDGTPLGSSTLSDEAPESWSSARSLSVVADGELWWLSASSMRTVHLDAASIPPQPSWSSIHHDASNTRRTTGP